MLFLLFEVLIRGAIEQIKCVCIGMRGTKVQTKIRTAKRFGYYFLNERKKE